MLHVQPAFKDISLMKSVKRQRDILKFGVLNNNGETVQGANQVSWQACETNATLKILEEIRTCDLEREEACCLFSNCWACSC